MTAVSSIAEKLVPTVRPISSAERTARHRATVEELDHLGEQLVACAREGGHRVAPRSKHVVQSTRLLERAARQPGSRLAAEPVGVIQLGGLLLLLATLFGLVLALPAEPSKTTLGGLFAVVVAVVMLGQLFLTRRIIFRPSTVAELLGVTLDRVVGSRPGRPIPERR
jgi:hypothetical protein